MDAIASTGSLVVRQIKEHVEVFTDLETANRYRVCADDGTELGFAAEVGSSFLSRQFLQSRRPFEIRIRPSDGSGDLLLRRPFRFYFHRLEVRREDAVPLGVIERRFAPLRRIFSVMTEGGHELFQVRGAIWRPWTFVVTRGDHEIGRIAKRWSGLLKETLTDADNFGVTFPPDLPRDHKALLLAAVFLIDFVYFEKRS
jgi:hypothetical protein